MKPEPNVFVVDDDTDLLPAMVEVIEAAGLSARGFSRGRAMLAELDPEWDGVILSDMRMPEISGLDLLAEARAMAPGVPFVLITAHGDVRSAVQAIQRGAFDFIEKPAPPEYLLAIIRRALETRRLMLENRRLKERIARGTDLRARLLGRSVAMRNCRRELAAVAPLEVDVLLYGEAGTGKQLAARALHDFSGVDGEFIALDAGSLTDANFTAIMQGEGDEPGVIAQAQGGTLYLEQANALPASLQHRVLALMEARRPGQGFRVIASAHGSIEDLRRAGAMTDDLYYRLSLAEVELPPLRDRENDIYLLLAQFLREAAQRHDRRFPELTRQELLPYRSYHWPGNLRELRNVAEKLVIGLRVTLQSPKRGDRVAADDLGYDEAMREFESSLLRAALQKTGGRKAEAAEVLGMPRKRLYLRMRACGMLPAGQE